MSELLVGLTRGGGAPPPSFERVEVLADGTVRAVVATASGATRADLAGRFELQLNGDRLAELERLATERQRLSRLTCGGGTAAAQRPLQFLPQPLPAGPPRFGCWPEGEVMLCRAFPR
jgi:hypothetical protein